MEHLMTAGIMSAPAALLCSKLNVPDDDDEKMQKDNNIKKGTKIKLSNERCVVAYTR